MIARSLLTLIIFVSVAAEATADKCSLSAMTNDCKDFKPDAPARIDFGDGTYIPNLLHVEKAEPPTPVDASVDQDLTTKLELSQFFAKIPASRMSERFKQSFLSMPFLIKQIILRQPPYKTVHVVWPTNSETATYQNVPTADFVQKRATLFTPDELKTLEHLVGDGKVIKDDTKIDARENANHIDPARVKRMAELVKFARESIVSVISQKHAPPMTSEEQALVDKINAIYYIDPQDPSVAKQPLCQGEIGNAFYQGKDHTFTICPNILRYPDSTVLSVIAHEFAHSIDSCRSQSPLLEVHQDKIPDMIQSDYGARSSAILEMKQSNPETPFVNPGGAEGFDPKMSPGIVSEFLKDGAFTTKVPAVPFSRYPFREAYECLTSGKNAFESVKPKDIRRYANDIARYRLQTGKDAASVKQETKDLTQALSTEPQCFAIAKTDQMPEVMADWMSAQVTGRYLKLHPPKTDRQRLASNAFFAEMACVDRASALTRAQMESQDSRYAISAAQDTYSRALDAHPQTLKRYEQLSMSEPATREALGCLPNAASACFDSYHASEKAAPSAPADANLKSVK